MIAFTDMKAPNMAVERTRREPACLVKGSAAARRSPLR